MGPLWFLEFMGLNMLVGVKGFCNLEGLHGPWLSEQGAQRLPQISFYWVAVKELKLSYRNGHVYNMYIYRDSK